MTLKKQRNILAIMLLTTLFAVPSACIAGGNKCPSEIKVTATPELLEAVGEACAAATPPCVQKECDGCPDCKLDCCTQEVEEPCTEAAPIVVPLELSMKDKVKFYPTYLVGMHADLDLDGAGAFGAWRPLEEKPMWLRLGIGTRKGQSVVYDKCQLDEVNYLTSTYTWPTLSCVSTEVKTKRDNFVNLGVIWAF